MDDLSTDIDDQLAPAVHEATLSRAERRDQQVLRILDAAKLCFVRSGFQGASMQQICSEAGMSPGALYRYFPSKEAIIEAITEADRRENVAIFAAMLGNRSVVDGVVDAAMAHITHINDCGIAPLFAEIRAESLRNPAIQTTCDACMSEISDSFATYIGEAIRRGDIDPPGDLETILAMLMAMGEGLAITNLPGLGFAPERIRPLLRAMVEGLLRPTGRADGTEA